MAGNITTTSKSVTVNRIDVTTPSLTVNNYSGKVGDNVLLSSKYTATFGGMSGSVTCKYGNTTITNVNYFTTAGTYSVSCTAYGSNNKNSGAKTMTIQLVSSEPEIVFEGCKAGINNTYSFTATLKCPGGINS